MPCASADPVREISGIESKKIIVAISDVYANEDSLFFTPGASDSLNAGGLRESRL